jgi:hypothetical protein
VVLRLAWRDGVGTAVEGEVGEAISAGRGVLQGVVEFGGRVERRAEGEDVRVWIESRIGWHVRL